MDVVALVAILIASLGLIAVGVLMVTRSTLKGVRSSGEKAIASEFPDGVIRSEPSANFFGVESKGSRQNRGNGALVLTEDRLWFRPAMGRNGVDIAVSELQAASLVSTHLGKSVGRDLLRVTWRTPTGRDSGAWLVDDLQGWLEDLKP